MIPEHVYEASGLNGVLRSKIYATKREARTWGREHCVTEGVDLENKRRVGMTYYNSYKFAWDRQKTIHVGESNSKKRDHGHGVF